MLSLLGGINVQGKWRGMRSQIRKDRRKCLKIIDRWPVMMLSFEDIIAKPVEMSRNIAGYLSPWFDLSGSIFDMADVVIGRGTNCRPDLSIESALIYRSRGFPSAEQRRALKQKYKRVKT